MSDATVVYVHGNGNKSAPESLKGHWDRLLFGEPAGERSRMAYYADLFYQVPLPDGVSVDNVKSLERAALVEPPPADSFVSELRTEIEADGIDPSEDLLRLAEGMVKAEDAVIEDELEHAPPAGTANLELLRGKWLREHALRLVARTFFKDVHRYFFSQGGEEIRERLSNELTQLDGPAVVVSHSLGTIVAYDTLHELGSQGLEIPLLVTLGSPLGIQEIQDRIHQPLEVPPGTARWTNAADLLDAVALDKTIVPEYAPSDVCVDLVVTNQQPNHHGIDGYLDKPQVQQPILESIRSST